MDLTFAGYRLLDVVGGPAVTRAPAPDGAGPHAVPPGCIRVHDAVGPASEHRVRVILLPPIDGDLVRRSLQRARTVEHPHLIADIEVLEQDGRVGVVAPWTAGGTLDGLLRLRGRLAPGEALTVLRPLTGALTAIGDAGVSHGALLPELVWFDEDGRPRLAGLAAGLALATAAGDEAIVPVGAPHLAPEVARGGRPDIRADLFSLGSVALLAVTGRSAWPAESAAEVLVQSAAGLWPEPDPSVTPPELANVITGLLAADPRLRPPAAVVQVELRSAGRPLPVDLTAFTDRDAGGVTEDPDGAAPPGIGVSPPVPAPGDVEGSNAGVGRAEPPPVSEASPRRGGGQVPTAAASRSARRRRRGGRPLSRMIVVGVAALSAGGLAVAAGLWWAAVDEPATAVPAGAAGDLGPTPGPEPAPGVAVSPAVPAPQLAAVMTGSATDGPVEQPGGPAAPAETTEPAVPGQAVIDWLDVVRRLDQRRAGSLTTADPAPLDSVYVPGPAQDADRELVADLRRRGLRVDGGTHVITAARITSAEATPSVPGGEITIEVEQSLPAYPVLDAAGRRVGRTPAVESATAVLVLRAVDGGFAIVSVGPA